MGKKWTLLHYFLFFIKCTFLAYFSSIMKRAREYIPTLTDIWQCIENSQVTHHCFDVNDIFNVVVCSKSTVDMMNIYILTYFTVVGSTKGLYWYTLRPKRHSHLWASKLQQITYYGGSTLESIIGRIYPRIKPLAKQDVSHIAHCVCVRPTNDIALSEYVCLLVS
jgi:hypothetical protein